MTRERERERAFKSVFITRLERHVRVPLFIYLGSHRFSRFAEDKKRHIEKVARCFGLDECRADATHTHQINHLLYNFLLANKIFDKALLVHIIDPWDDILLKFQNQL